MLNLTEIRNQLKTTVLKIGAKIAHIATEYDSSFSEINFKIQKTAKKITKYSNAIYITSFVFNAGNWVSERVSFFSLLSQSSSAINFLGKTIVLTSGISAFFSTLFKSFQLKKTAEFLSSPLVLSDELTNKRYQNIKTKTEKWEKWTEEHKTFLKKKSLTLKGQTVNLKEQLENILKENPIQSALTEEAAKKTITNPGTTHEKILVLLVEHFLQEYALNKINLDLKNLNTLDPKNKIKLNFLQLLFQGESLEEAGKLLKEIKNSPKISTSPPIFTNSNLQKPQSISSLAQKIENLSSVANLQGQKQLFFLLFSITAELIVLAGAIVLLASLANPAIFSSFALPANIAWYGGWVFSLIINFINNGYVKQNGLNFSFSKALPRILQRPIDKVHHCIENLKKAAQANLVENLA